MLTGLIGVVHLQALPGDPGAPDASFERVESAAFADAERLAEGGVDGVIVENFGSAPFVKGNAGDRIPAHQAAAMSVIVRDIVRRFGLPTGVNCLRNDAMSALGIAAATGASFVRVNVHTGAYVTDQGLIEGEAAQTMRYRAALGASVAVVADVLVKHATPLAPLSVADAVKDTLYRGRADGVIVTGSATGAAVDAGRLEAVRTAAGEAPVWIGSGLSPKNASNLLPWVDAAIVGTSLKTDMDVRNAVDIERVREMVTICNGLFRTPRS